MDIVFSHAFRPLSGRFAGKLVIHGESIPGFEGKRIYNIVVPSSCEAFIKGNMRNRVERRTFIGIEPITLGVCPVSASDFYRYNSTNPIHASRGFESIVDGELSVDGLRDLLVAAAVDAGSIEGFDLDDVAVQLVLNVLSQSATVNVDIERKDELDQREVERTGSHSSRNPYSLGGQRDPNVYRIAHQFEGETHLLTGTPKQLCIQIEELRAQGRARPNHKYSAATNNLIGKLVTGNDQAEGWYLVEIEGGYHWIPNQVVVQKPVKLPEILGVVEEQAISYYGEDGTIDWKRLEAHIRQAV